MVFMYTINNMNTITDLIQEYKNSEFKWGEIDCVTFATTVAYKYKNKEVPNIQENITYNDIKSALQWLKALGIDSFDDLHKAPELFAGLKKKDISEVKHGDIVYYVDSEHKSGLLGICNGVRAYFLSTKNGLTARNIEECKYCWSVE